MKHKILLCVMTIFLTCVGIVCMSCESDSPQPSVEPTLKDQLAVIQLPAEMLEYVLVAPIVDSCVVDFSNYNLNTLYYGNGLVPANPTAYDTLLADFARTQLSITGTNPYIVLDNGYVVVDWKWTYFIPLSGTYRYPIYAHPRVYNHRQTQQAYSTNPYYLNGTLANEEYYLLPVQWQELTNLTTIWSLENGQRIVNPEVRYINFKDLESYNNNQTSYKELSQRLCDFNSIYNLYRQDTVGFKVVIENFDQLQNSYVATINQMINNNEFDKWTKRYK